MIFPLGLFDVGFLSIRIWDILDILIVGYLFYQLFTILRGTIAFNIFIGVLFIFLVSFLVQFLEMELLSMILGQVFSVGVIMLLIVFQPEVRRFLLLLGNSTLRQRSNIVSRFLDRNFGDDETDHAQERLAVKNAILRMGRRKTGALIVVANDFNLQTFNDSGTKINAQISQPLIESIFSKDSPLHDGAMVLHKDRIYAASCVLPVSNNTDIPGKLGLRHRAAIGLTEVAEVAVFIVSEESGAISFATQGKLKYRLTETQLTTLLTEHFK